MTQIESTNAKKQAIDAVASMPFDMAKVATGPKAYKINWETLNERFKTHKDFLMEAPQVMGGPSLPHQDARHLRRLLSRLRRHRRPAPAAVRKESFRKERFPPNRKEILLSQAGVFSKIIK